MKKVKLVLPIVVLVLVALLSPRLLVLWSATWAYYHTDITCHGTNPTPPTGLQGQVPILVYEVEPFLVLTDRGYQFPGDEYLVLGESWFGGSVVLLWPGREGATFLVEYPVRDPESGRLISTSHCRWFAAVGDYR
jgi:hypothetical protein